MAESVLFFSHKGVIDFNIIEDILKKIREKREFRDLNKVTGKRVYSVIVECLENIVNHSAKVSIPDQGLWPYISVEDQDNKIIVRSGNLIEEEKKENLRSFIDKLNKNNEGELLALYEKIMCEEMKQGKNGAGLGFLIMRLKSGNDILYSFSQAESKFLFFDIQISIDKCNMRKLIIEKTINSPKVFLDPDKKIFEISGESRPPDVREFYSQVLKWFDEYSNYLKNSGSKSEPLVFNFDFEYFNSSSGKLILDICKSLATLRSDGFNLNINWHFEKDDYDMLEVGKELSKIVRVPFEYIEKME